MEIPRLESSSPKSYPRFQVHHVDQEPDTMISPLMHGLGCAIVEYELSTMCEIEDINDITILTRTPGMCSEVFNEMYPPVRSRDFVHMIS